jgi:uncharacterized spore protein YtfJ
MDDDLQLIMEKIPSQQAANALMERLFVVSEPDVVFSEPVTQGEYTAITAREITVGLGFGYGGGGGVGSSETGEHSGVEGTAGSGGSGYGGGGGGGGSAAGRPVAVIEIGPAGVRVEPIVDPTKIAIAMFTTLGSMALMLVKMLRQPGGD